MAVIIVQPSDYPPVRYNGRCWIRVGTRRATATPAEETRLSEKRRHRDLTFDLRPVPTASLADLDPELFRRRYLPASVAAEIVEAISVTCKSSASAFKLPATKCGEMAIPRFDS
jgi:ATP-dependent DNA helicase RecG